MTQRMTRAQKAIERSRIRRRARGSVPLDEYLANSISALKPWNAFGISRATFYRKPKNERDEILAKMRTTAGGRK